MNFKAKLLMIKHLINCNRNFSKVSSRVKEKQMNF